MNNKLKDRCDTIDKIICAISDIYNTKSTDDQKRLIETIIGAAIWYLPHNKTHWTGKISEEAIKALRGNPKAKLTKEHQFPKKKAAMELFQNISNEDKASLFNLYKDKYAKFNYVTPEENKSISKHQRCNVFKDVETAYSRADINLKEITAEELKTLKKKIKTT